jgi:hypothetical protein
MKALRPIKNPRQPTLTIKSEYNDGNYAALMRRRDAFLPNFPVFSIADFGFSHQMREMGLQSYRTDMLHAQAQQDFPDINRDSTSLQLYKQLKVTRFFAYNCQGKGGKQTVDLAIFDEADSNSFDTVTITADRVQAILENEMRLNAQQLTGKPHKPFTKIEDRKVDATPYEMAWKARKALVVARDNFEQLTGRALVDTIRLQDDRNKQIEFDYFRHASNVTQRLAREELSEIPAEETKRLLAAETQENTVTVTLIMKGQEDEKAPLSARTYVPGILNLVFSN